jgi:formylglycine-generating enzyme
MCLAGAWLKCGPAVSFRSGVCYDAVVRAITRVAVGLLVAACHGDPVGLAGVGASAGRQSLEAGGTQPAAGGTGGSSVGAVGGSSSGGNAAEGGALGSGGQAQPSGGVPTGGVPTGGNAALGGAPGSGGQPGPRGPQMVALPGFSIDATEVTRGQYANFLATQPSALTQARRCSEWNGDFRPVFDWPPAAGDLDLPVVGVDWCDAYAFCLWAGKRLCGRIGGGALGFDEFADATQSEWYWACSLGGLRNYPYGDTFDGGACNGYALRRGTTVPVGSLPGCRSNDFAVFDLSGNVEEWEDACADSADPGLPSRSDEVECRLRGGSFGENDSLYLRCQAHERVGTWRHSTSNDIGFRCCS